LLTPTVQLCEDFLTYLFQDGVSGGPVHVAVSAPMSHDGIHDLPVDILVSSGFGQGSADALHIGLGVPQFGKEFFPFHG
jgi:hypothetical protein